MVDETLKKKAYLTLKDADAVVWSGSQTGTSGKGDGHVVIDKSSPLKRLHYFDGKFLRAPDMQLEQQALLNQIRLSNSAGGAGVVHGYDITKGSGDSLNIDAGLAFDSKGRALQMAQGVSVSVAELIEKSRSNSGSAIAQPTAGKAAFGECELRGSGSPDGTVESSDLYLITICHAEAMCGEEDVYGKLCESACVSSTDRPYIIEGVSIHAVPLELSALLKTSNTVSLSQKHLRSRVASAYFGQERQHPASHISKEGLNSNVWCLGAEAISGNCVPIGVVSRSGTTTRFLDAWTVRRERMESPPRHYWVSIMAMRPWQVFLAQLLQFQCQLSRCLSEGGGPSDEGPCAKERALARKAAADLKALMKRYEAIAARFAQKDEQAFKLSLAEHTQSFALADIRHTYDQLINVSSLVIPSRLLINRCGIVELPSAGYLPVNNSDSMTINDQVRSMMGEGVDLRFCVVRPDYIPHALEEAQHMERICLLQGLDDPNNKPRVDVLVPDGRIEAYEPEVEGAGYEMDIRAGADDLISDLTKTVNVVDMQKMGAGDATFAQSSTLFSRSVFSPKKLIAARVMSQADEQPAEKETVLRGAARGEVLDSGGFAFYFAGRMPQLMRQVMVTLARDQILQQAGDAVLSQANSANDALSLAMASETAAAEDAASANTPEMMKENERAKAIEMKARRLNSGVRIARQRGTSSPIYDMWLSMRTEQDPFKLARGGFTNISGELVIMVSMVAHGVPVSVVIEVTQSGTLTVEDILSTGSEPRRRCAINSNGMINTQNNIGGQNETKTFPFKLAEQLYISRENDGGARPTFKLDLPELSAFDAWDTDVIDIDIGFQFARSWSSAEEAALQGLVTYLLRYATGNQTHQMTGSLPLFSGAQRINPDVLKPDNLLHDTSLTALREIGNGLNDSQFADIHARQLFPPPKPVPKELLVYGRRDWVFFHRRREKSCGYDEAPQVAVKPLRYRLYYVNSLQSIEDAKKLRRGLLKNDGTVISHYGSIASSIVEYDAGLYSVRTSHINLRNDWQALVNDPNAKIILGAIGSQGDAFDEGVAMAQMRLESASDVLAPVTPLDENSKLFTLPKVPDVLAEGNVDGVIILASVKESVETVCHQVYRVEMQQDEVSKFHEALQSGFNAALKDAQLKVLNYNPLFINKTAELASAEAVLAIKTAWQDVGNNQPQHLFVVTQTDAAGNVINDQPYLEQGQCIAVAVGGSADIASQFVTVPADISDCPGVSILVTTPQVQDTLISVYAYKTASNLPAEINKQTMELIQEMGYWEWLGSPDVLEIPMAKVSYDESDIADSANLSDLKNTAIAEGIFESDNFFPLFVNVISRNGSTAADRERNKIQATQINATFGAANPLEEYENSSVNWSGAGTSSVVLVAVEPLQFFGTVVMVANSAGEFLENTGSTVNVSVDEAGTVTKTSEFESVITELVENNQIIKNVEIIGLTAGDAEAERKKAEAILAEMIASGAATADTTILTRVASAAERSKIKSLGSGRKVGVLMTK